MQRSKKSAFMGHRVFWDGSYLAGIWHDLTESDDDDKIYRQVMPDLMLPTWSPGALLAFYNTGATLTHWPPGDVDVILY